MTQFGKPILLWKKFFLYGGEIRKFDITFNFIVLVVHLISFNLLLKNTNLLNSIPRLIYYLTFCQNDKKKIFSIFYFVNNK